MTKHEKKRFVRDLARAVERQIIDDIATNKVPEDWDGHDLRQLLADRFAHEAGRPMDRARLKSYRNDCLIHNL